MDLPKNPNLPDWFWDVGVTDKKYTKPVAYGKQKFTSINAQYQIQRASEVFGLYGEGWGVRGLNYEIIRDHLNKPIMMTLTAVFYYTVKGKVNAFEMSTDINMFTSQGKLVDDLRKKLLTDLTTKSLSKIGFNADVFLGMYDDVKYLNAINKMDDHPVIKLPWPAALMKSTLAFINKQNDDTGLTLVEDRMNLYNIPETELETLKAAISKKRQSFLNQKAK